MHEHPLGSLLHQPLPAHVAAVRVTGITANSRDVQPGHLFVAVRGTNTDGHTFIEDAVRGGAAAVLVEDDVAHHPDVAVIRVPDTRRALALAAAAWHGNPADALRFVGITGTVGKTSTLAMLEAILLEAGMRAGSVGSLGMRLDGRTVETGYTAPDPQLLHHALAQLVQQQCDWCVMEATSHALVQERLAGLTYDVGILTNLVPLEHADYHGSFAGYLDAKRLFFRHLRDCAPLVYNADNRAARRFVHGHAAGAIPCGRSRTAMVRVRVGRMDADGTRVQMHVRRELPAAEGLPSVGEQELPLTLRMLGRSNVENATLAAAAALVVGADAEAVASALHAFPAPRRRMQVVQREPFTVMDDTVGHPDSISALFEVVEQLAPRRVHIAFAVRGQRGGRINRHTALSLAIWCGRVPPASLAVTRSEECADELNRVEDREYAAFTRPLRERGIAFDEHTRLDSAVNSVLDAAQPGDLVLLLGAQGMDRGQDIARGRLESR